MCCWRSIAFTDNNVNRLSLEIFVVPSSKESCHKKFHLLYEIIPLHETKTKPWCFWNNVSTQGNWNNGVSYLSVKNENSKMELKCTCQLVKIISPKSGTKTQTYFLSKSDLFLCQDLVPFAYNSGWPLHGIKCCDPLVLLYTI